MEAATIHTSESAWEELTGFPGKGEVKVLRDEGGSKSRTVLVHIHAGGEIVPHAHEAPVQHYVLEGEYECEGKIYGAGTYRLFPKYANVPPISTQGGATVLMIYDPVC